MDNPSTTPESSPAQQVRRAVVVAVKRTLRAAGPAGRRTARALTSAHRAWRRSLQLRMGLITLVLSGSLVAGFGLLVAERNTTAQIDGVRQATREQLRLGAEYARDQLSNYSPGTAANRQITAIVNQLKITPEQGGGVVIALLDEGGQATDAVYPDKATVQNAITSGLRREVVTNHKVASQIVSADIGQNGTRTYLVYGTPVPTRWGYLQLYYFQPMDNAESITSDFRTSMALLGILLVALLVLVVMLVTRLVVNPIRIAARTAQRLSAGLLDQRMEVRGEDDLAMLAASFNQMAASLQRQIVRLEEMSRLQRRFTSDVSHELRTPLTTVRMAADLLYSERDTFDPGIARSAELLQHELDRFENLLSDLLEISRFDAGFAMLDAEPTDLGPIVLRVVDRLESVAERAGVEVEIAVPETPVIAEVDPRRIERVLRNLIGNAVEHAEGRPVVVTLGVDEHAAAVTVRDHGIGLKDGEEKLVFNRFWRADPSRARQTGGTGLGLSIALEDARLHGGWLEAWGEPGNGAQFRLTVPVRAGDRLASSPLQLMPSADAPVADLLDAVPRQPSEPPTPAHPAGVA
ncbi:two-component system sensor histidine kinase MtrB [Hamadaea flava]|uniref:Sensor histidine kinase MtrB n=1 Tax=Hamadaea flava TaxID=1742688 RepID=A0ABV8M1W6_9ACTN|nr:MtrAB system histidine kinase MtrB [Hamadaea flava]MCP2326711.1 two-component system sensor histidine kinase MtrB [Hamadaea flava]